MYDQKDIGNFNTLKPIIVIDSDNPSFMELYGSICAGRNTRGGCHILFASLNIVQHFEKGKIRELTPIQAKLDKKDLKEFMGTKIQKIFDKYDQYNEGLKYQETRESRLKP